MTMEEFARRRCLPAMELAAAIAKRRPCSNQGEYEAALKTAGVKYAAFVYPGTQHGFNNDTTPRYDENAAGLAWQRTVEFFNKNLRA